MTDVSRETVTYDVARATQIAADTWPIMIDTHYSDDGKPVTALRCAECGASLGLNESYRFVADQIRPLIMVHMIRSHGFACDPVKVET